MGLAGPKRRTKISADPNNTSWSSRTDRFGHKILTSQGWTPGSFLGASDAKHQAHYTAANASHIRVLLKDDNLGLGASRSKEGAETFGLDQFSGLLGRLNGKSEEALGKEDDARRDVRLRLWADRRGGVRFVSAGFLVGDKVEKLRREEVERKEAEMTQKRGKKRNVSGEVKDAGEMVEVSQQAEAQASTDDTGDASIEDETRIAKRQRKEEKRRRKAEKEERRQARHLRRAAKEAKRMGKEGTSSILHTSQETSGTTTPDTGEEKVMVESVDSSGEIQHKTIAIPRRMIRSRYIQQKRMAGLDPKALNECVDQDMSAKVHAGRITRSEDIGSKTLRVSLDGEYLRNFYTSAANSDAEEPPRKKVKTEHGDSEPDTKSPRRVSSIAIAQITFRLEDPPASPSFSPLCSSDVVDICLVSFEAVNNDRAVIKLGRAASKSAKADVEILVDHTLSAVDVQDMRRLAQLQRRSKSSTSSGVAYSQVELGPDSSVNKNGELNSIGNSTLVLQCTIYWPDGAAAPPESSQNSLDRDLLVRYYQLPMFMTASRGSTVTPQDFYEAVHIPGKDIEVPDKISNSGLQTELYPFQKRAVAWMLQREQEQDLTGEADNTESAQLGVSWRNVVDATGGTCYVSDLESAVISPSTLQQRRDIRGGILSEEMGLGKTCELLALICTNQRQLTVAESPLLNASKATLVVTPNTILQQWKDEISRHAPHLKWTHYEGMASFTKGAMKKRKSEQDVIDELKDMDVILVTYTVLASEVHFAVDPPDRSLRRKNYEQQRAKSPLVQIDWWRVCLDEAQMVESGVSKAAQTASLIPRQNAWAVSGTPVKKDVQDLRGLLIFLGVQPFASSADTWKRLVTYHETFKQQFKDLFGRIALRHTKDRIRDELRLPPQRRVVVTMPFTTVEEQNYSNLFEQMADECGVNLDGSPASGLWNPEDQKVVDKMREWLIRLRQTCLHPQVGSRNKKALGKSGGPLRTVEEVLSVMIEQNESGIAAEARMSITTTCLKGHILANAKDIPNRAEQALSHYREALHQVTGLVTEARDELAKIGLPDPSDRPTDEDKDDESPEQKRQGRLRNQLRNVLEMQHMCEFFIGTAYFQMKSADDIEENSNEWNNLEAKEVEHYDKAKAIRREILYETSQKASNTMSDVSAACQRRVDRGLPSMLNFAGIGGIETQRLITKADEISSDLERQTEFIRDWRVKVMESLLKPLVDVEDKDITGEEYEDSTKQQEEAYAYFDAFRAIVADRATYTTGIINNLVNHEMNYSYKDSINQDEEDVEAGREPPESRKLLRNLLDLRKRFEQTESPWKQRKEPVRSLRGLIVEARSLEGSLQWNGSDSARIRGEVALVKQLMARLQEMVDAYSELQPELEKDQELCKMAMNQRLEFYRQLQQLSDAVAPWREEQDETLDQREFDGASHRSDKHETTLATLRSKRRFLLHLREQSNDEAERICVICQQNFEQGVLTICGHQFCKDCINLWYREHRNCPVCKRGLKSADFHNITYKPRELRAHEETHTMTDSSDEAGSPSDAVSDPGSTAKIYTSMSASDLVAIKSVDLPSSRSFGTKIDTISRHLLHIRRTEPGCKTLIFSQYRDFLSVLSSALSTFKISHVSISAKDSIAKFRTDPSIEAFLLDAKTDSSGLNLVNATNVMLCEPLVNPGIELQAIARVHRIGQTRPTSVFMYLVNGTVEESVYELSVKRRLEVMHRSQRDKPGSRSASRGATPAVGGDVDKAERLEMQSEGMEKLLGKGKGGGENVKAEDLWRCLFGVASRHGATKGASYVADGGDVNAFVTSAEGGAAREDVARFVRAEAAEQRRNGDSG
ncbi:SNF2 family N-terminal domain-containing protein 10 [Elsinoe fawcettii]|nr:SNF2 family N-terminal domain-containing protein 10 [Elsinoe fawcettii]